MGLDMYLYAEGYESLSKHDYKDKGKEAFKEAKKLIDNFNYEIIYDASW